jgi:uncharacterized protein
MRRLIATAFSIGAIVLFATGVTGSKPRAAVAAPMRGSDQCAPQAPGGPPGQSQYCNPSYATSGGDDELSSFVESVAAELDAYWSGVFQQRGWQYSTPNVQLEGDGQAAATPCDGDNGPSVEHSYCPANDTIKLDIDSSDPDSFTSDVNDGRDGVVVFTIAHEWGHHLQSLRNSFSANTLDDELQADCLAGVFTATYYSGRNWQAEIDDTIASVRESGSPPDPERTHGTPAERAASFNKGYNAANVSACGL